MLYNLLIWLLEQENIGLDPQIMILHQVISEILENSDFEAGGGGGGGHWDPRKLTD